MSHSLPNYRLGIIDRRTLANQNFRGAGSKSRRLRRAGAVGAGHELWGRVGSVEVDDAVGEGYDRLVVGGDDDANLGLGAELVEQRNDRGGRGPIE